MSTFTDDQVKQLTLIVNAVLKTHAADTAAQAAADAAASGAASGTVAPPTLNPVTATPDALHAAATGASPPSVSTGPTPSVVNPLSGKPAYARFPSVPQAVLLEIMSHKLAFKDLAKLDVAYSRLSTEPVLSLTDGRLSFDTKVTSKHFSTPAMMLNCFSVFFDVLTFHVGATHGFEASWTVSHGWHVLERRILQFASTYKWSAVVSFLEEFYYRRVAEMLDGRFSGWWDTDGNLESFWLAGNLLPNPGSASLTAARAGKASSSTAAATQTRKETTKLPKNEQPCWAFAAGVCESPCRNGRKHERPPAST